MSTPMRPLWADGGVGGALLIFALCLGLGAAIFWAMGPFAPPVGYTPTHCRCK